MDMKPTEIIGVILQAILAWGVWYQGWFFKRKSKVRNRIDDCRREIKRLRRENRDLKAALDMYRPLGIVHGPSHVMYPDVHTRDYATPEIRSQRSHGLGGLGGDGTISKNDVSDEFDDPSDLA
ncbi:hypothetical protein H2198_010658 [Neophaeococcomyces mojaviensis]|uniref:Uncharacterized protein n=1 Tax=Neophaeococcomyces mojaviensis TaxID=3383035 RepID=A0ACC2ZR33_9EURO|nr:hypothetical protein H2198_010658 [Knufia sp. JES_112]